MSKVDAQRAMKSARHARAAEVAATRPAPVATASRPASTPVAAPAPTPVPATAPDAPAAGGPALDAATCGHRNMAGKACRRPVGHAEKSHRYT